MHDFQLCPWGESRVMIYCTCGWVGRYVKLGLSTQVQLNAAREDWKDHARNDPRTFDNRGRPIKQLPF